MGADKVRLAKLLQQHHCVVRGGPEEGQKLMQALLVLHSPFEHCDNAASFRILICAFARASYTQTRVSEAIHVIGAGMEG